MLTLTALDVRTAVHLRGVTPAEEEELREAWHACDSRLGEEHDADDADVEIWASRGDRGAAQPGATGIVANSSHQLADALSSAITLTALAERSDELLLLHASAVADPDTGAVIAFVGPSGRGKTTIARHLGASYPYVTDESVGVHPRDLAVRPYPKPLSVIRPGAAHPYKEQIAPRDLGLKPMTGVPLTLAAVVLLDRRPTSSAAPARIDPISFMDGIPDLAPQISYLTKHRRPLAMLRDVVERVGGLRVLRYNEVSELESPVDALFAEIARGVRRDPDARETREAEATATSAGTPSAGAETIFRRGRVDDSLAEDGRVAVIAEGRLVILDGIGPAIWDACEHGASREQIAAAVVDRFGRPSARAASAVVDSELSRLVELAILEEYTSDTLGVG
jgi:hypothetical protein